MGGCSSTNQSYHEYSLTTELSNWIKHDFWSTSIWARVNCKSSKATKYSILHDYMYQHKTVEAYCTYGLVKVIWDTSYKSRHSSYLVLKCKRKPDKWNKSTSHFVTCSPVLWPFYGPRRSLCLRRYSTLKLMKSTCDKAGLICAMGEGGVWN